MAEPSDLLRYRPLRASHAVMLLWFVLSVSLSACNYAGEEARQKKKECMICFRFWYKLLLPADYLLFHARILVQPSTCYRLLIIPRIPLKFQRGAFYSGFHKIEKSFSHHVRVISAPYSLFLFQVFESISFKLIKYFLFIHLFA